ncbi:ABC transporter permease [Leucobacter sp. NPDC058333]|uniref:ABC transporter permease n=1 Tax=Leucobacter sp. NPDC058333 TaxID=3346450 RepID=UPI00364F8A15
MPEPKNPNMEHFVAPFDETPVAAVDAVKIDEKKSNLWLDAWRDMRGRPMFWVSAVVIVIVIAVSLFPHLFTPVDPRAADLAMSKEGPTKGHILGFTSQGQDVFARIIYGTSTSVSVGLLVVMITFVVGTIAGSLAGFFGGWVDTVISRIGDIFFSIPYILAGVIVMTVFQEFRNPLTIAFAIGGFSWPVSARILRSEILRVRNADFVMASTALGLSRFKTLVRHVLPNSIAPLLVVTTISLSAAIVAEAVLSFLGVGLPPAEFVSWGNDISAAQRDLRNDPQLLLWPSLALAVTVFGFVMLGEVVRDALDPKARAQR